MSLPSVMITSQKATQQSMTHPSLSVPNAPRRSSTQAARAARRHRHRRQLRLLLKRDGLDVQVLSGRCTVRFTKPTSKIYVSGSSGPWRRKFSKKCLSATSVASELCALAFITFSKTSASPCFGTKNSTALTSRVSSAFIATFTTGPSIESQCGGKSSTLSWSTPYCPHALRLPPGSLISVTYTTRFLGQTCLLRTRNLKEAPTCLRSEGGSGIL